MKTIRNLLLGTVMAGLAAGPALADTFNVDIDATIATALGATQSAGISFGLFQAGTVDSTFDMFPSGGGAVTPVAGDYTSLTGGELGVVDITGTPNAGIIISTDGANIPSGDGSLIWLGNNAKCSTPANPGDNACASGVVDTLDVSGNLQLTMGGTIVWTGAHPATAGVRQLVAPLTVNYQ